MGMAFIDTETYIHKALAIKNFILVADINRSVQLLCYKVHVGAGHMTWGDRSHDGVVGHMMWGGGSHGGWQVT